MYACSKDELLECDCGQDFIGKLCREYHFENNECIGFIDYSYDDNLKLVSEKYSNKQSVVKKIINYEYNSKGQLAKKAEIYTDNYLYNNTIIYHYNFFDSLSERILYQNNSVVYEEAIEYDSLKNKCLVTKKVADTIQSYKTYSYDSDNKLWKIKSFQSSGSLIESFEYNYYYDNTMRINKYDSLTNFNGYELYRYNTSLQIIEKIIYDKDKILVNDDVFDYNDNRLSKVTTYDQYEKIISYILYKYQ